MKGLVTTATVSAPSSRAMRATTGAAPVAGAAAHAARDEDHVGAGQRLPDFLFVLLGRLAAALRDARRSRGRG
jgi:hypothetical protein